MTTNQLVVGIKADIDNAIAGIGKVEKRLSDFTRKVADYSRSMATDSSHPWNFMYNAATGAITGTISSLRNLSRQVTDAGRDFNYLAFMASSAMAAIGGSALKLGFEFNQMSDQAIRAFTGMLKSGDKARAFFNELKDFAIPTPFETDDLVAYAQRLLNVGIAQENVIPSLKAIGDYMTFVGQGTDKMKLSLKALTDMLTKGKVSLEELTGQLGDQLVPAIQMLADQQFGSHTEQNTKKIMAMIKEGVIPATWAFKALAYQMEKRAPDAMRAGSKDMSISLAGLRDAASAALGSLTRPAYTDFTNFTVWLAGKTQHIKQIIEKFSDSTKSKLVYGLGISTAIAPLTVVIEALTRVFRMTLSPIGLFVTALASALYYISQNKELTKQFTDIFKSMLPVIAFITKEFGKFVETFGKSMIPIFYVGLKAVSLFLNVVARLLAWFNNLPEPVKNAIIYLQMFGILFNPIAVAVEKVIAVFKGLSLAFWILTKVDLKNAIGAMNILADRMSPASKAITVIGLALRSVGEGFKTAARAATNYASSLLSAAVNSLSLKRAQSGTATMQGITGPAMLALPGASAVRSGMSKLRAELSAELKTGDVGTAFYQGIGPAIASAMNKLISAFKTGAGRAADVFSNTLLQDLPGRIAEAFAAMRSSIGGSATQSVTVFQGRIRSLAESFSQFSALVKLHAMAISNDIRFAFTRNLSEPIAAVKNFAGSFKDSFREISDFKMAMPTNVVSNFRVEMSLLDDMMRNKMVSSSQLFSGKMINLGALLGGLAASIPRGIAASFVKLRAVMTADINPVALLSRGLGALKSSLKDAWSWLLQTAAALAGRLRSAITNATTAMMEFVKTGLASAALQAKNFAVTIGTSLWGAVVRATGVIIILARTGFTSLITSIVAASAAAKASFIANGGLLGMLKNATAATGLLGKSFTGVRGAFSSVFAPLAKINWWIVAIIAALVLLYGAWRNNWNGIQEKTFAVLDAIVAGFMTAWAVVKITGQAIAGVWNDMTTAIMEAVHRVQEFFRTVALIVSNLWNIAMASMGESTNNWWNSVKEKFGWVGEAIDWIKKKIGEGFDSMGDALKNNPLAMLYKDSAKAMRETYAEQQKILKAAGGTKGLLTDFGKWLGVTDFKIPDLVPTKNDVKDVLDPGKIPAEASDDAKKNKKLRDLYTDRVLDLKKVIFMYGKEGEAAKVSFDIQMGTLTGLSKAQKNILLELAARADVVKGMEQSDKRYESLMDDVAKSVTDNANAIRNMGNQTETAKLQSDLLARSLSGLQDWQRVNAQKAIDVAVAMNKQKESMEAVQKIYDDINTLSQPKWLQDIASEAGGIAQWNQLASDSKRAEEFMAAFLQKRQLEDIRDINDAMNGLASTFMFMGDEAEKAAIDFVGSLDKWDRLPKLLQDNIRSVVSMVDSLSKVRDMRNTALDDLYESLHPIQTEAEKTTHALDELFKKGDEAIRYGMKSGEMINPGKPESWGMMGGPMYNPPAPFNMINPPTSAAMIENSKILKELLGDAYDFEKLFVQIDLSRLNALRDQLIKIKKEIDFAKAAKQINDWVKDFNKEASDLNDQIAGIYDEGEKASKDWLYSNRDNLEIIRRSFAQVGKESEFVTFLENVDHHIRSVVTQTKIFENAMTGVEKIAEMQASISSMLGNSFEQFSLQFKQFDRESRTFKLPDGMERSVGQLWRLTGAFTQLQEAQSGVTDMMKQMGAATKTGFASYLEQFKVLVGGNMALPKGFNEELAKAVYTADRAIASFQKMGELTQSNAKQFQAMQATSPFKVWLLDFEEFDNVAGSWKLPDTLKEKVLKAVYDAQRAMDLIQGIATSLGDSIINSLGEAFKPDADAAQRYQDLQKEIREAQRAMWSAQSQDKEAIANQIADLEKQANEMKDKVHRSTSDMFASLMGAIYRSFSKLLQDMASEILKSQLNQFLTSMLTKMVGLGAGPSNDPKQASEAALAAVLATNTAATALNNFAISALKVSTDAMAMSIAQMPAIELGLTSGLSVASMAQRDNTFAVADNTTAVRMLTGSVDALAATMGGGGGAGGSIVDGILGSLIPATPQNVMGGDSILQGFLPHMDEFSAGLDNIMKDAGGTKAQFASGGNTTSSGRYLVGEYGPEILDLPAKSRVTPLGPISQNSGGGATVHIHLTSAQAVQEFRRSSGKIMADAKREADRAFSRRR